PRADVDARPDVHVAEVGVVVGLGARAEARLLGLDEVAQVDLGPELAPRAHVGERADLGARADLRVVEDRVGLDRRPRADAGRAVEAHPRADLDVARELDVGIDGDRLGQGDGDALAHPRLGDAPPRGRVGAREVDAIVHAGHLL